MEHTGGYFARCGFATGLRYDSEAEVDGGRGSASGGDVGVDHHHLVTPLGFAVEVLHRGIAGGVLAVEQSERREHERRRGADGGVLLSFSVTRLKSLGQRLASGEIACSGHSSGQDYPFGIGERFRLESDVGNHYHVVGTASYTFVVDRHYTHVHAGTAKDIDSSEGFDFLEAVGKHNVTCFHFINSF